MDGHTNTSVIPGLDFNPFAIALNVSLGLQIITAEKSASDAAADQVIITAGFGIDLIFARDSHGFILVE